MQYYVNERKMDDLTAKTAWSKAREDAERICESEGFQAISVWPELGDRTGAGTAEKLRKHFQMGAIWKRQLEPLRAGDLLFLQLPAINNCFYLSRILKGLRRRGVRVVALVHDLETLRMGLDGAHVSFRSRIRMRVEERSVLAQCDRIIVHNDKMLDFLAAHGVEKRRMLSLGIFDYLMDEKEGRTFSPGEACTDRETLIVAGNLSPEKSGYVYALPEATAVNLYGVFYRETGRENLRYQGAFLPGELPAKLRGGFGLVWDGPSAETCAGPYGEYLRYNNPHKTSLYLASGFPVAIWDQAALAGFITGERLGIAVSSVAEAGARATAMPEAEYRELRENARKAGEKLRSGYYLKTALRSAVSDL